MNAPQTPTAPRTFGDVGVWDKTFAAATAEYLAGIDADPTDRPAIAGQNRRFDELAALSPLERRQHLAKASYLSLSRIPLAFGDLVLAHALACYLDWRWHRFRQVVEPVCLQLQLESLAGFPFSVYAADYETYTAPCAAEGRIRTLKDAYAHCEAIAHVRSFGLDPSVHEDFHVAKPWPKPALCIAEAIARSRMIILPREVDRYGDDARMIRGFYLLRTTREERSPGKFPTRGEWVASGVVRHTVRAWRHADEAPMRLLSERRQDV